MINYMPDPKNVCTNEVNDNQVSYYKRKCNKLTENSFNLVKVIAGYCLKTCLYIIVIIELVLLLRFILLGF